jgi:hypothetical protein
VEEKAGEDIKEKRKKVGSEESWRENEGKGMSKQKFKKKGGREYRDEERERGGE